MSNRRPGRHTRPHTETASRIDNLRAIDMLFVLTTGKNASIMGDVVLANHTMYATNDDSRAGTHHPRRCGFVVGCAISLLISALGSHAGELIFTEDFDSHDTGDLDGQNEWSGSPTNTPQVQTNIAFAGSQAVSIATNAMAWRTFADPTATNIWVDFFMRAEWPSSGTEPSLDAFDAGGFYIGLDGAVRVSSNSTWVTTSTDIPANEWRRFTANIDYATSSWSLYVASEVPNTLSSPVATGLRFNPTATNSHLTQIVFEN